MKKIITIMCFLSLHLIQGSEYSGHDIYKYTYEACSKLRNMKVMNSWHDRLYGGVFPSWNFTNMLGPLFREGFIDETFGVLGDGSDFDNKRAKLIFSNQYAAAIKKCYPRNLKDSLILRTYFSGYVKKRSDAGRFLGRSSWSLIAVRIGVPFGNIVKFVRKIL